MEVKQRKLGMKKRDKERKSSYRDKKKLRGEADGRFKRKCGGRQRERERLGKREKKLQVAMPTGHVEK